MRALLAALVLPALAGLAPRTEELPEAAREHVARLERGAQECPTFRQLLAENGDRSRRLGDLPFPELVRYAPPPVDALVYDSNRLRQAPDRDLQLAQARELARASMALPVAVVEAEAAAWQKEVAFALEWAAREPAFAKQWARNIDVQGKADALKRVESWARERVTERRRDSTLLPADEFDRLSFFSAALAHSPDRFYAAIERLLPLPPEAVSIVELDDLLSRHGAALMDARTPPEAAYVRIDGRRYPARTAAAAKILLPSGGSARVYEAVGLYESDAEKLSSRLRSWLKGPLPP